MTASFDDELSRMLAAAEQEEQAVARSNERFMEVAQALDAAGASRIWDADPVKRDRNIAEAIATYKTEAGATDDEATMLAHATVGSEIYAISYIAMVAEVSTDVGTDQEQSSRAKKVLMARFIIDRLDESWLRTADQLIPGEPLDLTKEADLQIYISESQERIDPAHAAQFDAINDILLEGMTERDEASRAKIALTSGIIASLCLAAKQEPSVRVELEAALDELARDGTLTAKQCTDLRAYMDGGQPRV